MPRRTCCPRAAAPHSALPIVSGSLAGSAEQRCRCLLLGRRCWAWGCALPRMQAAPSQQLAGALPIPASPIAGAPSCWHCLWCPTRCQTAGGVSCAISLADPFPNCPAAVTAVRLVNGPHANAGQLEVRIGGYWGNVAHTTWMGDWGAALQRNAAQVGMPACRMPARLSRATLKACCCKLGSKTLPMLSHGRKEHKRPVAPALTAGCVPPAGQEGRHAAYVCLLRAGQARDDGQPHQLPHRQRAQHHQLLRSSQLVL